MHVCIRGEVQMTTVKKLSVLMLAMIALIIPAIALSDSAAGDVGIYNSGDIHVTDFNDRGSGTVTLMLYNNDSVNDEIVTVRIVEMGNESRVFGSAKVTVPADTAVTGFEVKVTISTGSQGHFWAKAIVTGDAVNEPMSQTPFEFSVGRSIWSNTSTYIAIIAVVIIVGIALFLKMRNAPKPDETGYTFTEMEEDRKAGKGRTGAKREEYKGRRK